MAAYVDTGSKVWLGSLDLTPLCSGYQFGSLKAARVTFTNYAAGGFEEFKPGLLSGDWSAEVFQDLDVDKLDDRLRLSFATFQAPFTVLPNDANPQAGDLAWFARANLLTRDLGGKVGDAAAAPMSGVYDSPFARGLLLAAPAARTASGNGTAVALTGPTATQRLFVGVHVFELTGLTGVTVKVQSDDAVGMASPTDRYTSSSFTAPGSAWSAIAGGWSTETHLRATWTVTGTGSFTAAVVAAVL